VLTLIYIVKKKKKKPSSNPSLKRNIKSEKLVHYLKKKKKNYENTQLGFNAFFSTYSLTLLFFSFRVHFVT
jgi:hypothetical protein